MWKLPFVWKSLHLALLAAKEEQIRDLREQVSVLRTDRLRAETGRDVAVLQAFDAMKPKVPEPVETTPRRRRETAAEEPFTLDLAEVDPNDKHAIATLALREMPPGKQSGTMLTQKMDSMRSQVILARAVKKERAKQVGVLSAPEDVMAKIAAAEQEGIERARVN